MAALRHSRLIAEATAAEGAVSRLAVVLTASLAAGRHGAALTIAGDQPPAPELEAAADTLVAGAGTADAAQRAIVHLAGTAAAVAPGTTIPTLSANGPTLLLIAAQLRSASAGATTFVERRHATEAIVDALGVALAALDRDDPAAAIERLDETRAPTALLQAWEDRPPLMSYWMGVTGELIAAARGIAEATIAGDSAAQKSAAERYSLAAAAARGADNALAVTLTEEGAAASSGPLRRLAVEMGDVADWRVAVEGLIEQTP